MFLRYQNFWKALWALQDLITCPTMFIYLCEYLACCLFLKYRIKALIYTNYCDLEGVLLTFNTYKTIPIFKLKRFHMKTTLTKTDAMLITGILFFYTVIWSKIIINDKTSWNLHAFKKRKIEEKIRPAYICNELVTINHKINSSYHKSQDW